MGERLTHAGNKYQHDCLMGCEVPPEINENNTKTACEKLSDQIKLFRDFTCTCCEQQNQENPSECQKCTGCLAWYSIWIGLIGCWGALPVLTCGPSGCCACITNTQALNVASVACGVCGGNASITCLVNTVAHNQEMCGPIRPNFMLAGLNR